jgi:hypothetical protein
MPYQSYQLWDTARARTAAEQRAADERLGEIAAAVSGSFSQGRRKVRAATGLRSEPGRSARLAGAGAAAYLRAAGWHLPRDRGAGCQPEPSGTGRRSRALHADSLRR